MPDPRVFDGTAALRGAAGADLGASPWRTIDQGRIDGFAEHTDDHQWIHVDVARANAESPFGGPIAHGFLTLSLASAFLPELVDVRAISMGVNYGLNKVRFPAPVPAGSRLRAVVVITDVADVAGGVQVTYGMTFEVEGQDRPACVAEFLARYYD